jgi:hypothetical protein
MSYSVNDLMSPDFVDEFTRGIQIEEISDEDEQ